MPFHDSGSQWASISKREFRRNIFTAISRTVASYYVAIIIPTKCWSSVAWYSLIHPQCSMEIADVPQRQLFGNMVSQIRKHWKKSFVQPSKELARRLKWSSHQTRGHLPPYDTRTCNSEQFCCFRNYFNSSAKGNAEWNGQRTEYGVDVVLDVNIAKKFTEHHAGRQHPWSRHLTWIWNSDSHWQIYSISQMKHALTTRLSAQCCEQDQKVWCVLCIKV